jgi:hypothetical protein
LPSGNVPRRQDISAELAEAHDCRIRALLDGCPVCAAEHRHAGVTEAIRSKLEQLEGKSCGHYAWLGSLAKCRHLKPRNVEPPDKGSRFSIHPVRRNSDWFHAASAQAGSGCAQGLMAEVTRWAVQCQPVVVQNCESRLAITRDLAVRLQGILLPLAEGQAGLGGDKGHHKLVLLLR